MATWAIGDVHGCCETLERLVARLEFDEASDRLWLTGDLVNRGPRSLEVLRWAKERGEALGARFVTVLGNHDLHLLAVVRGVAARRKKDSLEEVLMARDRDELADWLGSRPLLHRQDRWLLVHAGVSPDWNVEEAVSWARRVERGLATPGRDEELLRRADYGADVEDPDWQALATFTRMRTLTSDGRFGGHTGRLDEVPAGQRPWFEMAHRRGDELTVVAGHWAALGLYLGTEVLALDTGAAWGGPLTAIRLDDRRVVQQANRDIR